MWMLQHPQLRYSSTLWNNLSATRRNANQMKHLCAMMSLAISIGASGEIARAAVFTVTDAGDDSHATNNTVTCQAGSPTCTFREALLEANSAGWGNSGVHEVRFDLQPIRPIFLAYSLPVVFSNLHVDGRNSGGGNVVVDGGGMWRIFLLGDDGTALPYDQGNPRRISVSLQNLTLRGGMAKGGNGGESGGGGAGLGGAVFVNSMADVTMTDVLLVGNSAIGGHGGVKIMGTCGGGGGMGGNGGSCVGPGNPFGGGYGGGGGIGGNGGGSNGWLAYGGGGGIGGDGGDGANSDQVPNNNTNLGGGGGGFNAFVWFDAMSDPAGDGADNPGSAGANAGGGGAAGNGSGHGNDGLSSGAGGTAAIFGGVDLVGGGGGFGAQDGSADGNGGVGGGGGGLSGMGGFGGGGGGGQNGGTGGFGGGGGAGFPNLNIGGFGGGGGGTGGIGGFGGGGGGPNGPGGYGGGRGGPLSAQGASGGGGAGFGGALFVREGGTVVLMSTGSNTAYENNTVLPGAGGDSSAQQGLSGGGDVYVDSGVVGRFNIANGATLVSRGTIAGRGGIAIEGGGRLALANRAEFESTAAIANGVLLTLDGMLAGSLVSVDGVLSGTGSLGPVTNHGVLAPFAVSGNTPGFDIQGALDLKADSLTCIVLRAGGTAPGLRVAGSSNLGGSVFVRLPLNPSTSARYTILSSAGNMTGRFQSVRTSAPVEYSVHYLPHSVELNVGASEFIFRNGFDPPQMTDPCANIYVPVDP